jgi:hypothetical protein
LSSLPTSAIKHAFPDRRRSTIWVGLHHQGEDVLLFIEDNGVGLTATRRTGSMGMRPIEGMARSLNGTLAIDGEDADSIAVSANDCAQQSCWLEHRTIFGLAQCARWTSGRGRRDLPPLPGGEWSSASEGKGGKRYPDGSASPHPDLRSDLPPWATGCTHF